MCGLEIGSESHKGSGVDSTSQVDRLCIIKQAVAVRCAAVRRSALWHRETLLKKPLNLMMCFYYSHINVFSESSDVERSK